MAERRMFAKQIVLSDSFLDMPATSRCLYFTLGMVADDDGFVNSPRSVMRQCGASDDDLRLLIAKRFLIGFESGVVVVKHWKINNYLQSDRTKRTTNLVELSQLKIKENKAYSLDSGEPAFACIQNVYIEQHNIDEYRLDKDSLVNKHTHNSVIDLLKDEELDALVERVECVEDLIDEIDRGCDIGSIKNPLAYCLAVARKRGMLK